MKLTDDYWHAMDKQAAENLNVSPSYIGISTPPMRSQVEGLRSRIFQGATHVELGFMGVGKGSMAQGTVTPEMHSREEREAMRHMAKINEITLTTHTSPNIPSTAGYADGRFSDETSEHALHEIERTVDFAADTAQGGPVVVHPGGIPRPLFKYEKEFEAYPGEKEKAPLTLVDDRTGAIQAIPRNAEIAVEKRDKYGNPIRDPETGTYVFENRRIADLEKEAIQKGIEPSKYIYDFFRTERLEYYNSESRRWAHFAKRAEQEKADILKYKDLIDQTKNKEYATQLVIDRMMGGAARLSPDRLAEIKKDPYSFINRQLEEYNRETRFYDEAARAMGRNYHQTQEEIKHITPIEQYGLKKSAETLARASIYAYDKEKAEKLEKPLFIAPENIFPEQGYSSHPSELKELILESRKAMADKLVKERRMSENQANKIASGHIKATFDIGHAYTWRKFFKGTDKEFNEWLGKEVDKLNKAGIIGHVHLSDNFGYYDEHVTPGEGKAPIQGFIKKMREKGYDKPMIVEPAHQDYLAMTGAWRALQSPVYRTDATWQTWTDIEHSYFGQTRSPTYVVGSYAPDYGAPEAHQTWRFWSEVPLE